TAVLRTAAGRSAAVSNSPAQPENKTTNGAVQRIGSLLTLVSRACREYTTSYPVTPRAIMKAEIVSIGSELTSGQNLDTNGQWLSLRLAEIGIPVGWHTTIADDLADNVAAFRLACQRAQLVIATGGLGPTL